MAQPNRRIAIAALIGAMTLAGGSALAASFDGDATLGNPKAKVKLVEYASLACSHCAAFNNEVFAGFKKKYIDTGKVHYTLREILTQPREVAAAGFLTARCAGPANYFTVVDTMFHGFDKMAESGDVRGALMAAGKAGGLTQVQVEACLTDEAAIAALNARVAKNAELGNITGTPTFVINGKTVKEGPMTAAELDAAITQALKPAKPASK